jgi:hypothetical protein
LGNLTLSNASSTVATFRTPLLVSHAQNCASAEPTLTLQMPTSVDSLTVTKSLDLSATTSSIVAPGGFQSAKASFDAPAGPGILKWRVKYGLGLQLYSSGSWITHNWDVGPGNAFPPDGSCYWSSMWEVNIGGVGAFVIHYYRATVSITNVNMDPHVNQHAGFGYANAGQTGSSCDGDGGNEGTLECQVSGGNSNAGAHKVHFSVTKLLSWDIGNDGAGGACV